MGGVPFPGTRAQLSETLAKEFSTWAEYVRLADIKPQ